MFTDPEILLGRKWTKETGRGEGGGGGEGSERVGRKMYVEDNIIKEGDRRGRKKEEKVDGKD